MILYGVEESISLDLAYLYREVPALIQDLAENAQKEVEDARNRSRRKGDEAVVSGEVG